MKKIILAGLLASVGSIVSAGNVTPINDYCFDRTTNGGSKFTVCKDGGVKFTYAWRNDQWRLKNPGYGKTKTFDIEGDAVSNPHDPFAVYVDDVRVINDYFDVMVDAGARDMADEAMLGDLISDANVDNVEVSVSLHNNTYIINWVADNLDGSQGQFVGTTSINPVSNTMSNKIVYKRPSGYTDVLLPTTGFSLSSFSDSGSFHLENPEFGGGVTFSGEASNVSFGAHNVDPSMNVVPESLLPLIEFLQDVDYTVGLPG